MESNTEADKTSFKVDIFDGTDFKYWSQKMLLIFKIKGWTRIVAPKAETAPNISNEDVAKDETVQAFILLHLSKDVFAAVAETSSAYQTWREL